VLTVAGAGAEDAAVREVLGAADRRLVIAVADAVLASDPGACIRHLAELHAHGYDAQRFCRDLLEHFRNLAVLRATGERALLADLPEAEADALAQQAERRSADDLQRFFRLLLETDEALAQPARTIDPKLVLEMCAVRLATLPPLVPIAAVSVGIVKGEVRVDLDYEEDATAEVDLNIVATEDGKLVEVQGTAEHKAFERAQLDRMLDAGLRAIGQLVAIQKSALES
jgi:DNA polymerase III gamma/tau subunit